MSRITRLAGLGACAGALLGGASTAQATCYSSTPATTTFADSPFDGEYGLAPELTTVTVSLDAGCNFAVSPGLETLIEDDAVFTYIDRDGNPATGSATWRGADVVVGTLGANGADYPPLLGTWDGLKFTFTDSTPVGTSPTPGGFSATVDRLGLLPGAVAGVRVGSIWQGYYGSYLDFAPELSAPNSIALPVMFSTTPPPPPAPLPAPVPVVTPVPAPIASPAPADERCRVPKVKNRSRGAAEDRLLDANCEPAFAVIRRYSNSIRKGRVIGTSPGTGAVTTKRVKLIVSKGRKPKRSRARAATARSVLERLQSMANAPLR